MSLQLLLNIIVRQFLRDASPSDGPELVVFGSYAEMTAITSIPVGLTRERNSALTRYEKNCFIPLTQYVSYS